MGNMRGEKALNSEGRKRKDRGEEEEIRDDGDGKGERHCLLCPKPFA
jgi:hypothetical protein